LFPLVLCRKKKKESERALGRGKGKRPRFLSLRIAEKRRKKGVRCTLKGGGEGKRR